LTAVTAFQFSNRKKQSLKSTLLAQQVFQSGNTTINALLGKKLHFYKPFPIFVSLFSILAGKEEEILANGGYFWWFGGNEKKAWHHFSIHGYNKLVDWCLFVCLFVCFFSFLFFCYLSIFLPEAG